MAADADQAGEANLFFDPEFYAMAYPDVVEAGVLPEDHYREFGKRELRYGCRAKLRADVADILSSGLLSDVEYARALAPSVRPWANLLELHLLSAWRGDEQIAAAFGDTAYLRLYPDVSDTGEVPLAHYIHHGRRQGRDAGVLDRERYAILASSFDHEWYRSQVDLPDDADALEDYLLFGRHKGVSVAPDFSEEYYLRKYPDIANAKVDPYAHFVQHGRSEGRVGLPSFHGVLQLGRRRPDYSKPTLLLALHECTRTGAPLLGLAIAEALTSRYNVVVHAVRGGLIVENLLAVSAGLYICPVDEFDAEYLLREVKARFGLDRVLMNSAETFPIAEGALHEGVPSVGLIHEFAEYSAGRIGRMISYADTVVVPSSLLMESAQGEVRRDLAGNALNLVVRPQGLIPQLPASRDLDFTREELQQRFGIAPDCPYHLILGAGFVHIRKGVDLFIQAADALRDLMDVPVKFVWVGHGFDPVHDHHYSLWLEDAIKRLDLQGVVYFCPPQSNLDLLLSMSSAFFLSSRLDPFPNVVLDAFKAGRPVVCFDGATGAAEWIDDGRAVGGVAPFGDPAAAARALADCLRNIGEAGRNRELAEVAFDFSAYADDLHGYLENAGRRRKDVTAKINTLAESQAFDASFHEGRPTFGRAADRSLRRYVARASKGLSRLNPRAGFSDNLYRAQQGAIGENVVPLEAAFAKHQRLTTHKCVSLHSRSAMTHAVNLRTAVHLHLYYTDLAAEYAELLSSIGRPLDVYVTCGRAPGQVEVEHAFRHFDDGDVHVLEVPNLGRDVGALVTGLRGRIDLSAYDILGHFHGKKTLAVEDRMPGLGKSWRRFLVDTLLGNRSRFDQIGAMFADDPRLGLVFAEDRNAVGWGENLDVAQSLARRLDQRISLPGAPFYPLGNMFWSRPEALASLWSSTLTWADYPGEPAPYDGTVLHALERMLPSICEAEGYNWLTVHDPELSW